MVFQCYNKLNIQTEINVIYSAGTPQILRNLKNKSTTGMSMSMVMTLLHSNNSSNNRLFFNLLIKVVMWTLGDMFKTVYFVARSAPMQFWICGTLQVSNFT